MSVVSLRSAGYRYAGNRNWVFRSLNLVIEAGEIVRVTGRNGAGKSTLLKVLSGVLILSEGDFQRAPETNVAYMDQFSGEMLAPDLTIGEQLKAAAARGATNLMPAVEMLAQFGLGLQDRLQAFVGHLSGGERQIVALLCSLAGGANVLCLDEFTAALDEQSAIIADQLLTHAKEVSNVALILVSHSGTLTKPGREISLGSEVGTENRACGLTAGYPFTNLSWKLPAGITLRGRLMASLPILRHARSRGEAEEYEPPQLLKHLGVAVVVFVVALFLEYRAHPTQLLEERLLEAIGLAVLAFAGQMAYAARRQFKVVSDGVKEFSERVANDERIIFARPEHERTELVSVVGIEKLQLAPERLGAPLYNQTEKWGLSISILRFDRVQDLLFSEAYLDHFFALRRVTQKQARVLIVNDRPRAADAVRAFLRISNELGIGTYIYQKGEFYEMIDEVRTRIKERREKSQICEILRGNPELNLGVSDARLFVPNASGPPTKDGDFILRFSRPKPDSPAVRVIETRRPGEIEAEYVKRLLGLMSLALYEGRLGVKAFEHILAQKDVPKNPWSPEDLGVAFRKDIAERVKT